VACVCLTTLFNLNEPVESPQKAQEAAKRELGEIAWITRAAISPFNPTSSACASSCAFWVVPESLSLEG
jgi:hypothetical protein